MIKETVETIYLLDLTTSGSSLFSKALPYLLELLTIILQTIQANLSLFRVWFNNYTRKVVLS